MTGTNGEFIDRHNALVEEHSALVGRYNKLVGTFNRNIAIVNPVGRPIAASEEQQAQVVKLRASRRAGSRMK